MKKEAIREFNTIKDYLHKQYTTFKKMFDDERITDGTPTGENYRKLEGTLGILNFNEGQLLKADARTITQWNANAISVGIPAVYALGRAFNVNVGTLTKAPTTFKMLDNRLVNFFKHQAARDGKFEKIIKTGFDGIAKGQNIILFHEEYGLANLKNSFEKIIKEVLPIVEGLISGSDQSARSTYEANVPAQARNTQAVYEVHNQAKIRSMRNYVNKEVKKVWNVFKSKPKSSFALEDQPHFQTIKDYFDEIKKEDTDLPGVISAAAVLQKRSPITKGVDNYADWSIKQTINIYRKILVDIKTKFSGVEHSVEQFRVGMYKLLEKLPKMFDESDKALSGVYNKLARSINDLNNTFLNHQIKLKELSDKIIQLDKDTKLQGALVNKSLTTIGNQLETMDNFLEELKDRFDDIDFALEDFNKRLDAQTAEIKKLKTQINTNNKLSTAQREALIDKVDNIEKEMIKGFADNFEKQNTINDNLVVGFEGFEAKLKEIKDGAIAGLVLVREEFKKELAKIEKNQTKILVRQDQLESSITGLQIGLGIGLPIIILLLFANFFKKQVVKITKDTTAKIKNKFKNKKTK